MPFTHFNWNPKANFWPLSFVTLLTNEKPSWVLSWVWIISSSMTSFCDSHYFLTWAHFILIYNDEQLIKRNRTIKLQPTSASAAQHINKNKPIHNISLNKEILSITCPPQLECSYKLYSIEYSLGKIKC